MKRVLSALAVLIVLVSAGVMAQERTVGAATTILVGDVGLTPDGAFPYTCGDALNPCDTIQHGIDTASDGDVIDIAAGTYNENVVVNKRLIIEGAGSTPSDTVIASAVGGTPVITIDGDVAGGTSAVDRLVVRDVRVEGATGGSGNPNSGILVTGSTTTSFITFDGVAVVNNTGNGIGFDHTGSVSDVEVIDADLSNNGNAGFRIPSSIASFDGLTVLGGTFNDNTINGIQTGGSGSQNVDNVTIDGTSFSGNGVNPTGGDGDISLFKYNGNATIKDVTIAADSHIGLQIRGDDALAPSGSITLDNVQITGSSHYGFSIIGFSDVSGFSFTDVSVDTSGNWGLYLENLGSALDIGNTTLGPSNPVAAIGNVSASPVDATGATFTGAADNFAIEDRVLHGIDAAGGGIVTWVPNNLYVTVNSFAPPLSLTPSIQRAIDAAAAGDTVNVGPGTFAENVNVNKTVEVAGSGQGATTIVPAISMPQCSPGSLCPGASNVVLIAASDVEIHDLTVDGDNTALAGGFAQGGADVNARNGIIENHAAGVFNNTSIHDVTVRNIYLRGIQVGSGGNNFDVSGNTVENVRGEFASIAIFNFGGTGSFTGNVVDDANDGIASNWSRGTLYENNTVTNAGSGIHTDNNGDAGSNPDTIQHNTVSDCAVNGFGIWVFAPFASPTVNENTVTNCAVGLSAAGMNGAGTPVVTFTNNIVDGQELANSTGVYVTTDRFGFGSTNVSATFTGNIITGNTDGFYVESQPGFTANVDANFNEISGNAGNGAYSGGGGGAFNADFTANWWGSTAGPAHAQNPAGTDNPVVGTDLPFSPWLGFGDADAGMGFQAASPMTWYVGLGVCGATCVPAAIDYATDGDTVVVLPGQWNEPLLVNKSITMLGAQAGIDPRTTCTAASETVQRRSIDVAANNVVIDGFTIAEVGSDGVAPGPLGPANPDVLGTGIYLRPSVSGHQVRNNIIRDNIFGVYYNSDGAIPSVVEHNCFLNNNEPGSASGDGIYSDQGVSNATVSENKFTGNTSAAMVFAGTQSNLTIDGNQLVADTSIVLFNTTTAAITGNSSSNTLGTSSVVFLGGGNDGIDVSGNTITTHAGSAVRILDLFGSSPNANIDVSNNTLQGTGASTAFGVRVSAGGVSSGLSVHDNASIRGHVRGVDVDGADGTTIERNNISTFNGPSGSNPAAVRVVNSNGVTIGSNLIDGGHTGSCIGGFWGIFVENTSGTIASNDISGIGNGITTGCQEGRAIEAKGTGSVSITSNLIDTYQKSGIIIRDAVNSIISGNTTTGTGPSNIIAMNGITTVSSGTTLISGNRTSGHAYLPQTDISCGILVIGTATVSSNRSDQDEVGICALGGDGSRAVSNEIDRHRQQGILVDGALNVLVDDNDIDGQGSGTTASAGSSPETDTRYYGIFVVDATGVISNNVITGIKHGLNNGTQSGVGIRVSARAGNSSDVDITGNTISDVQKNAMAILNPYGGTSVHADIDGNTVTGNGPIAYIAQNGIQVSTGASATVTNNDVSGYDYTPFTFAAIGILIADAGSVTVDGNNVHDNMEGMYVQQTDDATITNNTFVNNHDVSIFTYLSGNGLYSGNQVLGQAGSYGMYFYDESDTNLVTGNAFRDHQYGIIVDYSAAGDPTSNDFIANCIDGNLSAGMATNGTQVGGPVNAEHNWWGSFDGSSPTGHGDLIDPAGTIDADPFLTAPVVGCGNPGDTDGDGCDDLEELGPVHSVGGERDPYEFWDFFDVTGDQTIDFTDTLDVLSYFGDPGAPNTPGNLRDRNLGGPGSWNLVEANDGVDFSDVLNSLGSFGDSCAAP